MAADVEGLRRTIASLAAIERSSASTGERRAADCIAERFRDSGAAVEVEEEWVHGTYWWPLGLPAFAGMVASVLAQRRHRFLAGALAAAASAAVVDDLDVGRRWLRRSLPRRRSANVVAVAGDPQASKTLVLVSHHDAAHTGTFFDPRITGALGRLGRRDDSEPPRQIPVMAPIALAPAIIALASLAGWRRTRRLASLACAGIIASFADIALRPTVPGANDNLSGVATLVGVARCLQAEPVEGIRVILVSTGAEESLMEGMEAFGRRHFADLPRETTSFLCVDTVGSPRLVLPESEGMLKLRSYDPHMKEMVHSASDELSVHLARGWNMRLGTDGYVALRHGYPTAMIMSIDRFGAPSNYHWPTDTADRVDYGRVADTVNVCDAVIRRLAAAG